MQILADENFPRSAVIALRSAGYDVAWVLEDAPGSNDADVLKRAVEESRVLITFDTDFGELVFRLGLPASSGIILFRVSISSPAQIAQATITVIQSRSDWSGHFSVVEPDRLRMIPLPAAK